MRADAHGIMYHPPPDPGRVNRVTCQRCGHPLWDHHTGDVCVECDLGDAGSACGLFSLYGFAEAAANAIEERAFQH
jgi:uncharacterized Zn finger protein (UPF0148 family)